MKKNRHLQALNPRHQSCGKLANPGHHSWPVFSKWTSLYKIGYFISISLTQFTFFTIEQFDKCFATLKVDSGRDFVALTKNARSSSRKRKPHQKNNIRVKNVMAKKICIMFSRSIGNSCNRGQERFACRHYFLGKSTKMATKVKNNEIGLKRWRLAINTTKDFLSRIQK